ncbi:hypothetical protein [Paenibacillus humicola]|uniref:hypothetical protein n=1 Tax=Paenibacillus humicola TaxID=3110540 RepID=UPI00237AFD4A|nr:hypothetical protein [Paenibacillus humicola]
MYVYVESFPRMGSETDDTERIKRAIDSAVEFATVQFDPNVSYTITNIIINKSLTIDLNGASLTVDPTPGTSSDGAPVFWFKGIQSIIYAVADPQINQNTYTINLESGLGADFSANEYILIGDYQVIFPWNANQDFQIIGHHEINMIVSVNGDTLTLAKPTEWNYSTGPYVRKFSFIRKPKIMNAGRIREVNPGGPSTTTSSGGAHIFSFSNCMMPQVENCVFEGWNLHATNFSFCIYPIIKKCQAYDPFRPQFGGHGYFVRFNICLGGLATESFTRHVRHMVDWAESLDGKSSKNLALYPWGTAFYMHGVGSKRVSSTNDTVLGGETSEAWCMGNPTYGADFDFTITNPTYFGNRRAVTGQTNSRGLKIINPMFKTTYDTAIYLSTGIKDVTVVGGEIEMLGASANTKFVRALAAGGANVENVTIEGTRFKGNGGLHLDAIGTVIVDSSIFQDIAVVSDGFSACVRAGVTVPASDLIIRNMMVDGLFERAIYVSRAPTRNYDVSNNFINRGYTSFGMHLAVSDNMRLRNNTILGGSQEFSFIGDFNAAVTNGAIITGNVPNIYDKKVTGMTFFTPNTGGSSAGYWSQIGKVAITQQFQDSMSTISLISGDSSNTNTQRAQVFFRVKQQGAMGSPPVIELYISNQNGMLGTDLAAVVTQNDLTATVVQLYVKINNAFETIYFNPIHSAGSVKAGWTGYNALVQSLPGGTQKTASYQNGIDGVTIINARAPSVTVTHGLGYAPSSVVCTPQANIGSVWVTNITTTTFTINCSVAPASNTVVNYHAK